MKTMSKSAKIRKLLADGKSVADIAKKVGVTDNYVYYIRWSDAKKAKKTAKKPAKKSAKKDTVTLRWEEDKQDDQSTSALELANTAAFAASEEPNPLDTQVGGTHYKWMAIQPMEYSMRNQLDPCQHTIIKYVSRFRDRGNLQDRLEDLEKAKHVLDMLVHFERKEAGL